MDRLHDTRARLRALSAPGLFGDYDHVELIELVGTSKGGKPLNVLSIAVLSEGRPDVGEAESHEFLGQRVKIDGFKGWSFGVVRTFRPLAALDGALASLDRGGPWDPSGNPLIVGDLWPEPPMFAPPDSTAEVPLNGVLRNNFWAGSHVLRLTDQEKVPFKPFFDDRRRIQALSDAVSSSIPIAFAGLSDLLGDVIVQIPVTVMVPSIKASPDGRVSDVRITWRSGARKRPLKIAARGRFDHLLAEAAVSSEFQDTFRLPVSNHDEPLEAEILDAEVDDLIGAAASTSLLKRIEIRMNIIRPEPRRFVYPDVDGQRKVGRVRVVDSRLQSVGEAPAQNASYWQERRTDLEEKRHLAETRRFVQYRPVPGSLSERERALSDVRFLIEQHGSMGADLWDPYLTGDDILATLFWCDAAGAPLRGLTDGRDPPASPANPQASPGVGAAPMPFPQRQRSVLERDKGNCQGLRLEYRTRRGPKGWAFHDRFLIFPNAERGPKAWSLGTSVNSLGRAHHILHEVANPALISGAFQDLWDELDEPDHLIWRSW